MTPEARLRALYAAFNARDIDRVLSELTEDVDWPNAWEGGRVVGHAAVREYWTRQWAAIDPHVEPRTITELPDGTVEVEVEQRIRSLDGTLLAEETVRHAYVFKDGLVAAMHVH